MFKLGQDAGCLNHRGGRRMAVVLLLGIILVVGLAAPAMATTPTTYVDSETIGASVTAADPDIYQLSLYSGTLEFGTLQPGSSAASQGAIVVQNEGNQPFQLLISADSAPYNGWYWLQFVDYMPGYDQILWTLSDGYSEQSVGDYSFADFGTLFPGDGRSISSNVYLGGGLSSNGTYTWSATAYAVPVY